MLVDVHAHLGFENFKDDLDEVIARAKKVGIVSIINSGTTLERCKETLELAKRYDIVKASLGIFPTETIKMTSQEFENALGFIKKNKAKIVAVGEVGLDYNGGTDTKEEQKKSFQRIIEFIEKVKLPAIIHARKAEEDAVQMLESSKIKKVMMHCFSGSRKLIKRCEQNGWMFSIPTNITFSEHFQMLAKEVSMSQILTETDSPLLPPIKGQRNEPANVIYTIKKIAEIRNLDEEEVKKMIYSNYQKFFSK